MRYQRSILPRILLSGVLLLGCWTTFPSSLVARAESSTASGGVTDRLSASDCRADVRELVRLLAESHPDPYTGGGGRVEFYRKVDGILQAIPSEGMTVSGFLKLLRPLVASVRDGHTSIRAANSSNASLRTWIDLGVIEDRLYVSGVYREADRALLGCRIRSVQGLPWEQLVTRMKSYRGYDNDYGNLTHLAGVIQWSKSLEDLLSSDHPLQEVRIEVESADGRLQAAQIPVSNTPPGQKIQPATRISLPKADASDIGWDFLTADRSVAYLRVDSMMQYREAFESWRTIGMNALLGEGLESVAAAASGGKAPEGVDARIAAVPSATETFAKLFGAMLDASSSTLIVDLRQNSGGNSVLDSILGYYLFPLESLDPDEDCYAIQRISKLLLDYHQSFTLDAARSDAKNPFLEMGDLDFSQEANWRRTHGKALSPDDLRLRLKGLDTNAATMPTFYKEFKSRTWNARWHGTVIVLTSANTYSAGYQLAAMLYKHGATLVGVPSGQAGNCFIDQLNTSLPHSGLKVGISYLRFYAFPDDPKTGQVLRPQVELNYRDLAAVKFDPNATVIRALQVISDKPKAKSAR